MNTALWNAHVQAADLREQNLHLKRQLRAASRKTVRCVYCGTITHATVRRVCHAHSDLPRLDAGYHT